MERPHGRLASLSIAVWRARRGDTHERLFAQAGVVRRAVPDLCRRVYDVAVARKAVYGPSVTLEACPPDAPEGLMVVYARECDPGGSLVPFLFFARSVGGPPVCTRRRSG